MSFSSWWHHWVSQIKSANACFKTVKREKPSYISASIGPFPDRSLPIPPICLSGQSQPSSVCVHHAALVLNFPSLLLTSWKSNGRVLGGRRLLYASEKEQSVPTEGSSTTLLQNLYIPRLSCHPRFLCSCRLIDYSILLLKRKKQAKKKKSKPPLSFLLSFSLSLSNLCREMVNCFVRT